MSINCLDLIKEDRMYRGLLDLKIDDLNHLQKNKFQDYMEKYNGKLCNPIIRTYNSFQDISPDRIPPSIEFLMKLSYEALKHGGGMENFRKEVLCGVESTPPKCEELYMPFAKALLCICCIQNRLYL